MITVDGVSKSFGQMEVLKDVSFTLPASSVVGLIGPSGGGKSVLMKILGGVIKPDSGQVSHAGNGPDGVSLMFQEGALFDSLNVFDNVAFPLVGGRVPTFTLSKDEQEQAHARVDRILAQVGLSGAAAKVPAQLSGGMKRRVSLARALVSRPQLVLLDDPTCGLDPVASSVITDLILELQRECQPAMLVVSHDLRRLLPVVDQVLGLFHGHIAFRGVLDELRALEDGEIRKFVSCRYDLQ